MPLNWGIRLFTTFLIFTLSSLNKALSNLNVLSNLNETPRIKTVQKRQLTLKIVTEADKNLSHSSTQQLNKTLFSLNDHLTLALVGIKTLGLLAVIHQAVIAALLLDIMQCFVYGALGLLLTAAHQAERKKQEKIKAHGSCLKNDKIYKAPLVFQTS